MLQKLEGVSFEWVGPPAAAGPLPAICYFALSARESLLVDPFNQPVLSLLSACPQKIRIFSLSLPSHGEGCNPHVAIGEWAKKMNGGEDVLAPFLLSLPRAFDQLLQSGLILEDRLGLMGLSRGAFIALHAAALHPKLKQIVGFAPMTDLKQAKEFSFMDIPDLFSLYSHLLPLSVKTIRFYIGNCDTRVGTRSCFELVEALVQERQIQSRHPIPIELFISSSIGHMGHGTAKHIFKSGALWLAAELGIDL